MRHVDDLIKSLIVPPGKKIALSDYDPGYSADDVKKQDASQEHKTDLVRAKVMLESEK